MHNKYTSSICHLLVRLCPPNVCQAIKHQITEPIYASPLPFACCDFTSTISHSLTNHATSPKVLSLHTGDLAPHYPGVWARRLAEYRNWIQIRKSLSSFRPPIRVLSASFSYLNCICRFLENLLFISPSYKDEAKPSDCTESCLESEEE